MKVFIIGIAGGVGRRVAKQLARVGDQPGGLVRRPEQAKALASAGIRTVPGDLVAMSVGELAAVLRDYDAIVFSAGAGGKQGDAATTRVDGDGPGKLALASKRAGVRRFILVSVFPEAWRERRMNASFEHYMVQKKRAETQLVRTDLDWLIVRPSALTDAPGAGRVDLGLAKVHTEIARDDVAATIVELLRTPSLNRLILELTGGGVPICEAVGAMTVD
ncbi:NAD(P)H-binding protein [Methylophaga pinxianii]|uniref:NAD(P)H-binding protein n=1 Tax=Methylophaga pinxianii TaxID=2881052 RepID=UPI001CF5E947|nr:NAD(P)H-binding protein [Methylophaga pinxianii]MCB2426446.1 NAD(P)H-binding protein [Methylophaga pinxianii]UPH45016.1 NAD(P)H-binding protein [Methylophaga pinxianii]